MISIRLDPEWRRILRKAWSVRFIALAAVLTGVEAAMPVLGPIFSADVPAGLFAALSGLATAGALVARIVAQSDV